MHWDLNGVMLWLRVTARISGILLAAALAAPALPQLWSSSISSWMSTNRHRFTLLFALSHTLHLGGVITLASLATAQFFSKSALPGLVIGSIGYGLIYYLAWMAFSRLKNPAIRDSRMQTIISYILWMVFTLAFTIGAVRNMRIYAPLAAIMIFAGAVLIWAKAELAVSPRSSATTQI